MRAVRTVRAAASPPPPARLANEQDHRVVCAPELQATAKDVFTKNLSTQALVRPHLEYANSVWSPYKKM